MQLYLTTVRLTVLKLLYVYTGIEKNKKMDVGDGSQVYRWSESLQVNRREGLNEPCVTGLQ